MKNDGLGDRMKRYEQVSSPCLVRRVPVVIRVDGKAFHTIAKLRGWTKPFDQDIADGMVQATKFVMTKLQGCKVAYTQSDEVTFVLTDYDTIETDAWFGYNVQKLCSVAASLMSVAFNVNVPYQKAGAVAVFDARAFNVPDDEVANCLLWRMRDWKRNSLSLYARSFFSDKELHGKSQADMHEMLHGIGKNWATDLTPQQKNGTFVYCDPQTHQVVVDSWIPATYEQAETLTTLVLPKRS